MKTAQEWIHEYEDLFDHKRNSEVASTIQKIQDDAIMDEAMRNMPDPNAPVMIGMTKERFMERVDGYMKKYIGEAGLNNSPKAQDQWYGMLGMFTLFFSDMFADVKYDDDQ
jgi:hypothetical protein|tara:strand:+ start:500 stop:832 length:333 start_codon:yes stop_codon:yes gene_type:complete